MDSHFQECSTLVAIVLRKPNVVAAWLFLNFAITGLILTVWLLFCLVGDDMRDEFPWLHVYLATFMAFNVYCTIVVVNYANTLKTTQGYVVNRPQDGEQGHQQVVRSGGGEEQEPELEQCWLLRIFSRNRI